MTQNPTAQAWAEAVALLERDAGWAGFLGGSSAVMVLSLADGALLHANETGRDVAGRGFPPLTAKRLQQLGQGLAPSRGVRLERLELETPGGVAQLTAACRRLKLGDGGSALLVSAQMAGAPAQAPAPAPAEAAPAPEPMAEEPQPAPRPLPDKLRFIWELDAEGRIGSVSAEAKEAFGQALTDAMTGRHWSALCGAVVHDPDRGVATALAGVRTWSGRESLWRIDGGAEAFRVTLSGLPLTDASRALSGWRGFGIIHTRERLPFPAAEAAAAEPRQHDASASPAQADSGPGQPDPDVMPPPADASMPDGPAEAPAAPDDAEATAPLDEAAVSAGPPAGIGLDAMPEPMPGAAPDAAAMPSPNEAEALPHRDNVVHIRPLEAPPRLSHSERNAFREIAKALGARLEGEAQHAPGPQDQPALPPAHQPAQGTPGLPPAQPDQPEAAGEAMAAPGAEAADDADEAGGDAPGEANLLREPILREQNLREQRGLTVVPHEPEHGPDAARADSAADGDGREGDGDGLDDDADGDSPDEAQALPVVSSVVQFTPPQPPRDDMFAALLDKLPIGVLVMRSERIVYANRTLLDLLGHDDLDGLLRTGANGLFRGAAPGEGGGVLALNRADGTHEAVDARLSAIAWQGEPATLMSFRRALETADDARIAALRLDVERAREQARELSAILDTATDGVATLDERGRILSLNRSAEALFGYDQREVIGENITLLLAPESHITGLDYLEGLKGGGVAALLNDGREVQGRVRQGGRIPLSMTMGRVTDGDERKYSVVLRDMTAWKRAEADLVEARRQAEKASAQKSDVLAKISHEIRTPLNAILGFTEVMSEERFGPIGNERYKEYLTDIHQSGGYLISLINDLLDLAKIEAGKMDLTFTGVNLNDIASAAVSLLQPEANRQRVVLRTGLQVKLPSIVADERSLRQIVINILSNAVKFTDAGGQVILSTALGDRGEVVLRVRDTGIGMTEKELGLAMEPFRQISSTRRVNSAGTGGTGLGLPITKALVEANKGAIQISSAKSEGTLVEVIFPPQRVLAS